jgi:hypothetical protein
MGGYYGSRRGEEGVPLGLVALVLVVLITAVTYTGPYLVFYALPFLVISAAVGWIWQKACVADIERVMETSHERLSIVIPATIVVFAAALWIAKPEPSRSLDLSEGGFVTVQGTGPRGRSLMGRRRAGRSLDWPEIAERMSPQKYRESWNELASEIYERWYRYVPFVEGKGPIGSGFSHFVWVVGISILLGAPVMFLVTRKDWANRFEKEMRRKHGERADRLFRELRESEKAREKAASEHEEAKGKYEGKIKRLWAEIERLRVREKYLTDGKPKPLTVTPEKPDLDYLR